jgi:transposase-like protein
MPPQLLVCPKCGSDHLRKNGHWQGCAQFYCKACNYRGRFNQKSIERAQKYKQVEQLLLERNCQRSMARLTGVSRPRVAKLTKKSLLK